MRELPDLPKKVKGALVDFRVYLERPKTDGAAAAFENGDVELPVIRVSPRLCKEFQWQAFFHELIHACELEQGLNFKDDAENSDVDKLATALTGMFFRNNWSLPGE